MKWGIYFAYEIQGYTIYHLDSAVSELEEEMNVN
jgi:hypothetical protein